MPAESLAAEPVPTSSYLAACRRRTFEGCAVTAGALAVVAAGSRRHRGLWIVPAVAVAVAGSTVVMPHVLRWVAEAVPDDVTGDGLQPAVDEMSAVLGLRPPVVIVVSESVRVGTASTTWPRAIVVPANYLPPSGRDVPGWLLASLAHELGHHLLVREHWFANLAARSAALAGLFGALNGPASRRVTVVAGAGMVVVPALWASRWAERAADEVSRLLGHGDSAAWYMDWYASEVAQLRGIRSAFARLPRFLRVHPPPEERARLIRDQDERARVVGRAPATRLAWPSSWRRT